MNLSRTFRVWSAVLVLLPALLGRPVLAQQSDSIHVRVDSLQEMMGAQMEMMGPMMGRMAEASMTATLNVLTKPQSAERLATFTRNYYNALIKKGFTKDEALRIVTSVGLPVFRGQ
jgi:hypothetical protein